jgi:CHAD domain-containing protein/CYTH domain-containing protein
VELPSIFPDPDMDRAPKLLDAAPEAAARIVALGALDEASAAAGRLRDEGDTEALHDFRVALRRFRSFLRGYRALLEDSVSKKHRRALRELAAETTVARDTEVQLAWLAAQTEHLRPVHRAALAWLIERLEQRHREAYAGVRGETLRRFVDIEPKLRERLSHYVARLEERTPHWTFASEAGDLVRHAGDTLAAGLGAVRSTADVEASHLARILAKRLRYLLEPLRATEVGDEATALVKHLKGLQDILGELHDAHVMAEELASAQVESATERVRRLHEALYVEGAEEQEAKLPRDLRAGLLAIDRHVRDRIQDLFSALQADWLGERFEPFAHELNALADALSARGARHLEIERKYLLRDLPPMTGAVETVEIVQGWLPGDTVRERLRRVDAGGRSHFYRTIKTGSGIARVELEDETDADLFESLWPLTKGRRVTKRRHRVREGDYVWEVDEFLDRDLVLAEVELPSTDASVELPDWLRPHVVREVTSEAEYKNENLAR